jgi:hypothetical protein
MQLGASFHCRRLGLSPKRRTTKGVRANSHFATQQHSHHQYPKIMNINISFKPDGTAHCLWTEAVPLHELGRLEITRASHMEFNNGTQHWEVKDLKGKVRFIARSRAACLEWEQQNLKPD